jgi:hypothetical protein
MKTQMLCDAFDCMLTSGEQVKGEGEGWTYLIPVDPVQFRNSVGGERSFRTHRTEDLQPTKKRGRPCSMLSHLGMPEGGQTTTL